MVFVIDSNNSSGNDTVVRGASGNNSGGNGNGGNDDSCNFSNGHTSN